MELKRYNYKLILVCIVSVFISFIYGFILQEDSLGGAYNDYKYHEQYFFSFATDFKSTLSEYGNNNEVRNSPIFYIIVSKLIQFGFELEYLRYLNLIFIFGIISFFLKSLKINYENINQETQIFFICTILLSPTIRSLTAHPYPLLWAINFFIISIYFYLKFKKSQNMNIKMKNSFFCILNLSIASYFTPNFAMFILFYGAKFLDEFKFTFKTLILAIFVLFLALPAIFFLIWKDFYLFHNTVYKISYLEKFNFANKLIIISSILFLFILPLIKKIKLKNDYFNILRVKNIIMIIIFFISIYLFNFKSGAGGGLFYQISNIIFNNNLFLFLIFLISIILFDLLKIYNLNNILILITIILYNLQYTIYYKYFDPVLLFALLFFFKFDKGKIYSINSLGKRYFVFYVLFLLINLSKNSLKLILT